MYLEIIQKCFNYGMQEDPVRFVQTCSGTLR